MILSPNMKIYLASDHRGRDLAQDLMAFLDWGADLHIFIQGKEPVDYPDVVPFVVDGVRAGEKGVLICGTGIGMSIAANRFKGIRAALCHTPDQARLSRLHNDANILVLAGDLSSQTARSCLAIFLHTPFEGGRHERRLAKIEFLG